MAIEIERKFLVTGDGWRTAVTRSRKIMQGYLTTGGGGVTVRVRIVDDAHGFLTIKGGGSALARAEFEYEVPIADARQIVGLSRGGRIEKTRHLLDLPGGEWVVDEFGGRNAGLMLAEVELETANGALSLPDWLGEEVTGDARYYNSSLAMLVGGEI